MFLSTLILFCLKVAKLNKCIHTGLPTSLCYFHEAFCKINPSPLLFTTKMLLKNISSLTTLTALFICNFSSLVSLSLQICSLVKYGLKQQTAHKPTQHSGHLNSVPIFLCTLMNTQSTEFSSLPMASVPCALCQVSLAV